MSRLTEALDDVFNNDDVVAFDKETELENLHKDDIYYKIAEFLHIDSNADDFEETIYNMKMRLDELDLEPEKYLELLNRYQEEGKDIHDVLDDYEFGDID